MIDKNKPLEEYSKEELLEALNSKKEIESYFLLKLVYEENRKTNKYYEYFDDFLKMIYGKSSFTRMRGFGLCSSLAKWDVDNKLDAHLQELLILFEDEKPTTVRVVISCIKEMLGYKPHLAEVIKNNISRIDCSEYKDTMAPLIRKDIVKMNKLIDSILESRDEVMTSKGELKIVDLREKPEIKDIVAEWFHSKWGVPLEAYLKCMEAYLSGETELGWFLCLDGEKIVAGLGVIENDFHDRKDLTPNVCAVYTEEEYRRRGIAGKLLDYAVAACKAKGIAPLYLVTDHTGFYERYGWEFLCMVQGDNEPGMTRMYIHR